MRVNPRKLVGESFGVRIPHRQPGLTYERVSMDEEERMSMDEEERVSMD
jgi:hypothetical protein